MMSFGCAVGEGDNHIEGAAESHNQFLGAAKGVAMAQTASGHVVNPIDPLDFERAAGGAVLNEREVASRVFYARNFKDFRLFQFGL